MAHALFVAITLILLPVHTLAAPIVRIEVTGACQRTEVRRSLQQRKAAVLRCTRQAPGHAELRLRETGAGRLRVVVVQSSWSPAVTQCMRHRISGLPLTPPAATCRVRVTVAVPPQR